MTRSGFLAAFVLFCGWGSAAVAGLSLLMFEQPGCIYCARWTEEVGPEYPLTEEGRAAPLTRIDLHAALPEAVQINSAPIFTPTFVLLSDGVEVGRIEGYPGEDFFWPLLDQLIRDAVPSGG